MNQTVIFHLNDGNEIIKEDIPSTIIQGLFDDPDKQLCDYSQVDYQQVNSIEVL